MPTKQTPFRLTEREIAILKWVGEQLVDEGVYAVRTPAGVINVTAVMRHLIYTEEKARGGLPKDKEPNESN